MKFKQIFNCLKHGILPYWCYEKHKHYECSYYRHLLKNFRYGIWLLFNEE